MHVICFGDSNTYGYDPRSYLGDRYDPDSRWVDILAQETGWTVDNLGQNGREIPTTAPTLPPDTDLLILMLGTNDLLQGRSPEEAAAKLEHVLSLVALLPQQILLLAPPPMTLGEWVCSSQLVDHSHTFVLCCQTLAHRLGIPSVNTGDWGIPLAYDGVHFTQQGHKTFASKLLEGLHHETKTPLASLPLSATHRMRRWLHRERLSADFPRGSKKDDGHPGSHHPGRARTERVR